jgi:hypothetical protein
MMIIEKQMVEDAEGKSCHVTDVLKNITQNISG